MIVDAHLHAWCQIHGTIGGETSVQPLRGGMIQIGGEPVLGMPATFLDCAARVEMAIAEFDAAGVDMGVIVQEYVDGEQNDYLLEVWERSPERLFVHGLPDFFEPDGVVDEAQRLFSRGFRGLKLPAEHLLGKVRLDDPRFARLWQCMEEEGYVLAADLAAGDAQVPEMENILNKHPTLRVAIGHLGMVTRGDWLSQIRLARYQNVYMECGGIIWLFRHERYPFPGATDAIRRARDEIGINKLMWGSDWPRTMVDFTYRQSLDFIRLEDNALTEEEKEALLGLNAARLYNLPEPREPRAPVRLVTEE